MFNRDWEPVRAMLLLCILLPACQNGCSCPIKKTVSTPHEVALAEEPADPYLIHRFGDLAFVANGKITTWNISPDGQQLAIATESEVAVWEIDTARKKYDVQTPVKGIERVAFSTDNRYLAIAGHYDNVLLYNVEKAKSIEVPANDTLNELVAFSPDGKTLAIESNHSDGIIFVDTSSGKKTGEWTIPNQNSVHDVEFSPDGKRIGIGGRDDKIYLLDAQTKRTERELTCEEANELEYLGFSSDGKYIMAKLQSNKMDEQHRVLSRDIFMAWDVENGEVVYTKKVANQRDTPEEQFQPISAIKSHFQMDQDPDKYVFMDDSGNWELINFVSQTSVGKKQVFGSMGSRFIYNPTRRILALRSGQKIALHKWSQQSKALDEKGHSGSVEILRFSKSGGLLATGGQDRTVRLWNVGAGKETRLLSGFEADLVDVGFLQDDNHLVVTSGNTLQVFELQSGKEICRASIAGNSHIVQRAFGSLRILTYVPYAEEEGHQVLLWDSTSCQRVGELSLPEYIESVSWLADGSNNSSKATSVLVNYGQQALIWDVSKNETIRKVDVPDKDYEWSAGSGTGRSLFGEPTDKKKGIRKLMVMDDKSKVHFYDVDQGSSRRTIKIAGTDVFFAFARDNQIVLHSTSDGRKIATLKGHLGEIEEIVISEDGCLLASSSKDSTAILWKIPAEACGSP